MWWNKHGLMKLNYWTKIAQTFYTNPWDVEKLRNLRTANGRFQKKNKTIPVSYTHLTLPTKLEV